MTYASAIIAELPKRPVDEILAELERVREARKRAEEREAAARRARRRLVAEEATLMQLVELARIDAGEDEPFDRDMVLFEFSKGMRVHEAAKDALIRTIDVGVGFGSDEAVPSEIEKPGRPSTRELIAELMRAHPEREFWTSSMIRRRLVERGIEVSINLIGTTLRRMSEDGQLASEGEGRRKLYKLLPEGAGGKEERAEQ